MLYPFSMFGENLELYEVREEYVSYLRRFEPKKILSNADHKNSRKFIGLIIKKEKLTE